MPNSKSLSGSWKIGWVLLIVMAAVFSSRMSYMAPVVLAMFYPVAQMISIAFVPNASYYPIWLFHIIYWVIVLSFGIAENVIFIGMLASSLLGEILIRIIIENAVKWKWLLYNTCAMIVLIVGYKFVSSIDSSYQPNPTLVVALMFGLSALVSAQGIELKDLKDENKKRPSLESDDL